MLKKIIVYVGYTSLGKMKCIQNITSFLLSNSIIPDEVLIEKTDNPSFPVLLDIKNDINNIQVLIINDKDELGPNKLVADIAFQELSKQTNILEIKCEQQEELYQKILKIYTKAIKELEDSNKVSKSANNLLGYRMEYRNGETTITLKESEVKAVRTIFGLRIVQGRNLEQIKTYCVKHNIKKPDGSSITIPYICKLFESMNCYTGLEKLPGGQIIDNIFPKILLDKVFTNYYLNIWNLETQEWKQIKRQFRSNFQKVDF